MIVARSHVHTFVSKTFHEHVLEIRKIDGQKRVSLLVPASPSIFQMKFPETGRIRGNAPTRSETVPTCPALPTYN